MQALHPLRADRARRAARNYMIAPLNIPLTGSATTRRDSGRVAALVGGIVFGCFIGVLSFRAQFVIAPTLRYAPEGATNIRILKTHANAEVLDAHIGRNQIFPGAPWTIDQLLHWSRHEMTVSLLPNGTISYAIDVPFSNELQRTAEIFGMNVRVNGNVTTVSAQNIDSTKSGIRISASALLPWRDGDVHYGKTAGALTLNNHHIGFGHMGIAMETVPPTIQEGTTVLAYLTSVNDELALPTSLNALLSSSFGDILDLFTENGGTLLITQDAKGVGYVLTTVPGDLTSEELAAVGRDMMNRTSLSTQSWTIDDGSTYSKIVGPGDDIAVDIRAEEDFTYISLKDAAGNIIRMTKTPYSLTVANREIAVEKGAVAKSSCLHNASSWIQNTQNNAESLVSTKNTDAISVFMQNFSEIAVGNSETRLCW